MSAAGEKVWLVALTEKSAEPESEPVTGHRLYASAAGASEGLRDMFVDMLGIDDLPPGAVIETKTLEELNDAYYGDFEIEERQISYLVIPLPVEE
ncbi:hypothetical protein [uncultured Mycobacterium sp.]|uniref:hypothetical protein n=1 Tax=uncultured Mycobacterium sp. TaxID=171292 RepID=UPI0035CB62D3